MYILKKEYTCVYLLYFRSSLSLCISPFLSALSVSDHLQLQFSVHPFLPIVLMAAVFVFSGYILGKSHTHGPHTWYPSGWPTPARYVHMVSPHIPPFFRLQELLPMAFQGCAIFFCLQPLLLTIISSPPPLQPHRHFDSSWKCQGRSHPSPRPWTVYAWQAPGKAHGLAGSSCPPEFSSNATSSEKPSRINHPLLPQFSSLYWSYIAILGFICFIFDYLFLPQNVSSSGAQIFINSVPCCIPSAEKNVGHRAGREQKLPSKWQEWPNTWTEG